MITTHGFSQKHPLTFSLKQYSFALFLKYPLLGMLGLLFPFISSGQFLLDPPANGGNISIVTASSSGTNSSIAVAYSIRQLKTTYDHTAITPPASVTGFTNSSTPLIRVKRSFDNALLDIGYDGNGNLDTVTLKNFVTGKVGNAAATNPTANGRVSILYDQSGNSRDASVGVAVPCPTQTSEPYIVTAGVIERNGGGQVGIAGKNGGMLSDGGTTFDNAASGFNRYGIVNDRTLNVVSQPRIWSTVGGSADGNGTYLVDRNGGVGIQDPPLTCIKAVGNYWSAQIRNEGGDISQSFAGIIPISVNRSDNVTIIRNGDSYPMYVNGVLAGTGTLSGSNSQSPVRIGYGCQYGENVYYGELILFPSALSNSDLAVLNASQNSYFALGATPGLWTGATSSNWSVASNWSNNTVPDAITEVQIPSGTTNSLVITGGQTTFAAKSLSVDAGATVTINGNLNITGNVIANGTINGTGTLSLTGSLDQTVSGTPAATISNLIIANTAGTVTATTNLNVSGTLTVNSGTIFSVDAASVVNNSAAAGTLTGSGTVMATRITSVADFQSQYKFSTYTLSGLTVNYAGEGAQIVNLGVNYSNLIVSGSGIKTLSTAVTATNITGNITVSAGTLNTNNFAIASPTNRTITIASGAVMNAGTSVINFGSGTKQMTITGTLQTANTVGFSGSGSTTISNTPNNPTITLAATSTVEYNASATQAVTARTDYGNVVLSSGSKTITGTNTLAGSLTISSGATYSQSGNPVLNIAGNFTNNGTFTSGTGTVTFNGTGAQTISSTTTPLVFGGAAVFSGASSTATMAVNATVATDLTVSSGKTLDLVTFSFNRAAGGGGTLLVPGTLKLGGSSGGQTGSNYPLNFAASTLTSGTVEYNGSNAISQVVFATTYANLTLTNGTGSGNAAKTSSTSFTVNTGTMTVGPNVTFTPTSGNVLTGTTAGVITGTGTIEIVGNVALTVQYNFSTRTLNNLTVTYVGSSTLATGTYANLNITTGTTTVGGTITVTGGITIGNGTLLLGGSNTINVAGNWVNNGTFTAGTSTVVLNGTATQSVSGVSLTAFNNLTISNTAAPVSLNRAVNLTGTLTINASATLIPDDTVIINSSSAAGTISGNGTANVTRTLATADYQSQYKFLTNTLTNLTVNYAGLGNQTVNVGVNYGNLAISGSGTKTLSAAITTGNVTGATIAVNAATFATGNFNIACAATRTITVASGAAMDAGTSIITFGAATKQLTVNGTLHTANLNGLSGAGLTTTTVSSTNTPTITLAAGSTVEYTASSSQNVTTATTYSNLVLSNGSKVIGTAGSQTVTVSADLTVGTGATYLGTTNNPILNLAGNLINNGTFTQGTALFTMNGATQTISGTTIPTTMASLTISSTVSATLLVNATISGNLTVSSTRVFDLGTFTCNRTASGGTLTVAGTLELGGNTGGQTGSNFPTNFTTLTFTGGTIDYNGSNAITQTVFATTAYHNLTLTNGSGTGNAAKISTGNFTVAGTRSFAIGLGVTFTPGSGNVITGTSATLIGTGGTIDVTGGATLASQYVFTTKTLDNLTVNYTGSGSVSSGTYSTLTLNGTGTISLTGNVVVVTDVVIGSTATLSSAGFQMDVNGDWINNGAYTAGGSTIRFVGSATQTIGGSSVTSFANVTVTNTTSPIVVNRAINISGTLDLSTTGTSIIPDDTVVINSAAAAGTLSGSGTIKVTRIAATADLRNQYKFSTYTLTSATVDYTGLGAQTINNTVGTYGALIVSGTGTKTLQGNTTVTNDVTFTSGSFATGGADLTTSGNLVNNGVNITGTGNFNLNGASKTISGTVASSFPVLVVGSGASYTMNNNNTCTGLTFTASAASSSFTHSSNNSLIVNGNVTINQPNTTSVTSSWNINASTVSVTGTLTMGGATTSTRVARIIITTGSLSVVGTATLNGSATTPSNTLIDLSGGAASLTFGGAVTVTAANATLTPGSSSTVLFSGTVAQTIPFSSTFFYYNLNTANSHASGATLGATVTAANLTNNLTLVSGLLNTNNLAVTFGTSKTLTVSTGATFNTGTSIVSFGTGGTVALSGTFKTANTAGFSGTATTAVNFTNTPTITIGTSSTVEYSATGQTVTNAHNYNNLTLSNATLINTANANIVVNGALTTTAGGTFALTTFTLSGTLTSVSNSGTITTTCPTATSVLPIPAGKTWGGTVNYSATTGVQTIVSGTYNNLTLSNTSATNTAGGDLTINGNIITSSGGTFAMSTFVMDGNPGTITNPGNITTANTSSEPLPPGESWGAGTVTYTVAGGGQTIVAGTYTNLVLSNTSSSNTAGGNLTINGNFTANGGASGTLAMGTFAISGTTGTVTNAGTITTENTSGTPFPTGETWGAGTVNYIASSGGQTVMAGTYATLTLGNTSGTQTASGNIVCTTLNNSGSTSILNMVTFTLTAATSGINNTGTIRTQNTSSTPFITATTIGGTVMYDAATGGQTIQSISFTNLNLANTSGTNTFGSSTINIAGTFNLTTKTVTIGTSTVNYNGTGPQTIADISYNNLQIGARSSGSTIVTFTGTTNIAGTATFNATATYDVTGSTINYNGAGQTLAITFPYNNLTLGGSGGKTFPAGTTTINGVLSIENGTNANTFTGSVAYGASATLQYNVGASSRTTSTEFPGTFAGEGGVIVSGSSGGTITFSAAKTISFALTINTGGLVNLNAVTTHTSTGLVLGGVTQTVTGTYGASGAGAGTSSALFTGTGRITFTSPVLTWDGSAGTDWATANNWTPATVPTASFDVVIPDASTTPNDPIIPAGGGTCRNLTVQTNGILTSASSSSLTISGDYLNSGSVTWGSSTAFNIAGTTNQSFAAFTTTGAVTVSKTTGIVTLTGVTAAASVTYNPGANNATTSLVINSTLTLSAAFTVNSLVANSVALTLSGSGTLSCASFALGSGAAATSAVTTVLNSTLTNIIASGNLTITSSRNTNTNNATFNHSSGTISVGGSLTTVVAANAASIATYTMGNSAPQLNLSGGTPFTNTGITGVHTITLNGTGAIVNYNGTGAQTARVTTYTIMKVNNTAGVSLATGTNNIPTLTIGDVTASSIFNDAGFAITTPNTLNLISGTYNLGSAGTATTWPAWTTVNMSAGTTVGYVSGQSQTISTAPAYKNLTFSGAGAKSIASGTLSVAGDWSTTNGTATFTTPAGATVTGNISGSGAIASGAATVITLGGNWSNNGTFTKSTGTVDYNGTGAQSIAAISYHNLTVSGTRTGSPTITLPSGTISVSGTFTNSATGIGSTTVTGNTIDYNGTGAQTIAPFSYNNLTVSGGRSSAAITLGSGTINVAGTFSVTATAIGSYVTTGNTVNYSATTGGQSVAGFVYNNLSLGNTSGTNTASGNIVVDGTLTQAAGGTLDLGAFTLTGFLNTVTNNGTIITTNIGQTPLSSGVTWGGTGLVNYLVSSGSQSVMTGTYQNLTINNTSGTQTASGNIAINGALTLSGGTLDMATYALSGSSLTTSGTGTVLTQNITSTPLPSGRTWNYTVQYNSSSSQTIVSGNYTNLTASGGNRTLANSGTIGVSGTFTVGSGTYTSTGSTVNFNGTSAQTIPAITYNNLTLSNTRTGSPAITLPSGTITVGGTFSATATGVGSFVTTGNTLIYSGAVQSVAAITYGDLTLSGTGLKTLAGNTTVNGTITVGGTSGLDGAGFTLNVLGAWINNATYTGNTSTVVFMGSSPQTMSGTVAPVFNALTVNNSNGVTMSASATVSGLLSLSSGKLAVGSNTLTLNGTMSTTATNSITGNGSSNITIGSSGGSGTIFFDQTLTGTTNKFATVTVNRTSSTITIGNSMEVGTALALTNGKLAIGSNTLTLSGSLTSTSTNCFVANASSNLAITGSGSLGDSIFFDQSSVGTSNRLVNLTFNRTGQTVKLGNAMQVTGTVSPTAGTLSASGKLTLISNAAGTANIASGGCTTCSYITGNVAVQRFIPAVARRYRFIGATVQSATLADWQTEIYITGSGAGFDPTASSAPSVYWYDETMITGNLNTGWTAATSTSNAIVPGKGYRVFVRGDRSNGGRLTGTVTDQNAVTLDLVGVPNQGNISAPVSVTKSASSGTVYDPANDGWNMVSNPYPCGYNWNAHYDDSTTHANIEPVIWVLSGQSGGYVSYNAWANAGSLTTGIIPAGASFWVKANNNGVPNLTFKEQYKITTAPLGVFKTNEEENFSMRLYLDSITYDDATVKFMDGSTDNYDAYDIRKLAGTVTLSVYGDDNIHLDLSTRPLKTVNDTIKLYVNGVAGNYKLFFNNSNEIAVADNVFLFDTYLSTVTDLKVTDTYNFDILSGVAASSGLNRFYIVMSSSASMPVKLLQFKARKTGSKQVTLNWATTQETNSKEFVVERSADGSHFSAIGTVGAAGNTNKLMNYEARDEQPMHNNYYRLKEVDIDGSVYFSLVQYVMMDEVTGAKLYPIPAHETLTIEHTTAVKAIYIYDVTGHLVNTFDGTGIVTTIDVSKLKTGIYFIEYFDEAGETLKTKFSKE